MTKKDFIKKLLECFETKVIVSQFIAKGFLFNMDALEVVEENNTKAYDLDANIHLDGECLIMDFVFESAFQCLDFIYHLEYFNTLHIDYFVENHPRGIDFHWMIGQEIGLDFAFPFKCCLIGSCLDIRSLSSREDNLPNIVRLVFPVDDFDIFN